MLLYLVLIFTNRDCVPSGKITVRLCELRFRTIVNSRCQDGRFCKGFRKPSFQSLYWLEKYVNVVAEKIMDHAIRANYCKTCTCKFQHDRSKVAANWCKEASSILCNRDKDISYWLDIEWFIMNFEFSFE